MTKTLKIFAIGVIMSVAGNTQAMHTYDEVVADETCAIALNSITLHFGLTTNRHRVIITTNIAYS